ncbi:hypothetical protein CKQ90_36025, partial [Klebsiella pneumoniae]
ALAGRNHVVFNDYIVRVISTIFIFMILAVSYNLIVICIALAGRNHVVFNDYIVRVISTIFIFMILAVSYNL